MPHHKNKKHCLADVQNSKDTRNIPIDKVGIRGLSYPITLMDKNYHQQSTVATINMYVDLPHEFKGTHMSRFIEVLNQYQRTIDIHAISELLLYIKAKLNSKSAHVELHFPYFIEKKAPVTQSPALLDYNCRLVAGIDSNNISETTLTVDVPVTSLCPCSREMSEHGAHNQRSIVTISACLNSLVWIEELIAYAEQCGSAEVYALLKRADEKFVTDYAYDHPRFVEDIAREVSVRLMNDNRIDRFSVSVENFESIHNHNAYAFITRDKKKQQP